MARVSTSAPDAARSTANTATNPIIPAPVTAPAGDSLAAGEMQ
jgi:hypothetical protein